MKKLYGSFAAKLIAVILLCVLVLVFAASAVGALLLYNWGGYTESFETFEKYMVADRAISLTRTMGYIYRANGGTVSLDDPNLRCTILDSKGEILWTNYENEKTIWQNAESITPEYSLEYVEGNTAAFGNVDADFQPVSDNETTTIVPVPTPSPTPEEESEDGPRVREDYAYPLTSMKPSETRENCLRILYYRNRIAIEAHVRMDGQLPLSIVHERATTIEHKLKKRFGAKTHVTLHMEPVK